MLNLMEMCKVPKRKLSERKVWTYFGLYIWTWAECGSLLQCCNIVVVNLWQILAFSTVSPIH